VCASFALGQKRAKAFPTEVVIGRDSFIDVGPPFNYYDLTFLHSFGEETDVERVSLTPPSDSCYPHAEIRVSQEVLKASLSSLLQDINPCSIPEKKLMSELKRHKEGAVFSGMNVVLQVQCSGKLRVIHTDILDRDIFDEHSKTPQYTSWTKTLFDKLDKATGDKPWDELIFAVGDNASAPSPTPQLPVLKSIADGQYDEIFGGAPDRPSALYRMAQAVPRHPLIELATSDPVRPTVYVEPIYPPIAKAARVQGIIDFHLKIGGDGSVEGTTIDSGPRLLWQAARDAIAKWRFSSSDSGKVVRGSIRFGMNCVSDTK